MERYNVKLVTKGYKKKYRVDYEENFVPVVVYYNRRKYTDTRFNFIREYVDLKEIKPNYVKT